jgi:GNAT superfamily N-acetyltransferase
MQHAIDIGTLTLRPARPDDAPELEALIEASLAKILDPILTENQRRTMRLYSPLDERLIEDRTYYVLEVGRRIAAAGGWSRRAAMFRSREGTAEPDRFLDPATESAIIRAMYTHPDFARRGLGALMLAAAEAAARVAGFRRAELVATPVGARLYQARGWKAEESVQIGRDAKSAIEGARMSRDLYKRSRCPSQNEPPRSRSARSW